MQKALTVFDSQKIKKVIIDVRNNPGGSLEQVVEVAKHFVPNRGAIVHIEYKDNQKQTYYSDLQKTKYEVVVLINEGSASASEILAGAIQDSKAGKIVGVKSFGKGTVQEVLPLRVGGAIKMTIARYLTPNGRAIDGDGIHPDIEVKNIKKKVDANTLEKLSYTVKPTLGDKGKDVLAAEQRLKLLGYDVDEPDEILDEKTFKAIKDFQAEQKLFSYGVLDITTQIALNNAVQDVEIEVDKQLEKAMELLSK
jgi:carboxyl-terminal processing protease